MDRPVFDLHPRGIAGRIDLVLTNPPLGDTNYVIARDHWAEFADEPPTAEESSRYLQRLGVVPMRTPTLSSEQRLAGVLARQIQRAEARIDQLRATRSSSKRDGNIDRWEEKKREAEKELKDLERRPESNSVQPSEPTGEHRKGGAIFLGAIAEYLKIDRMPDAEIEWQGGRAAVVVDEAILNTPDYADVREFIRRRFFVKAVISLGRAAFKYLAHTDAKTSILYLVRKSSDELKQREPTFFAHAERVGYSSTGKWIGSDLPDVLARYTAFREEVMGCYARHRFDTQDCIEAVSAIDGCGDAWHVQRPAELQTSRLDFFNARYHDIVARLEREGVKLTKLSELIEPRTVVHPPPSTSDTYEFATIERKTATVRNKGRMQVGYSPTDLWVVRKDDIVVSGIDLVHGSVAVANKRADGLVMSKEMYPYSVRRGAQVLPEYMALLLRTDIAKTLIHG